MTYISFSSIHFEYRRSYIIEKEKKKTNGEEEKKFSHAITKCDYSAEDPKLSRARITLRVNKISADPYADHLLINNKTTCAQLL